MKNWKTTLFGAIGAIYGIGAGVVGNLANGLPIDKKTTIIGLIIGLVGYFAKDAGVTGTAK